MIIASLLLSGIEQVPDNYQQFEVSTAEWSVQVEASQWIGGNSDLIIPADWSLFTYKLYVDTESTSGINNFDIFFNEDVHVSPGGFGWGEGNFQRVEHVDHVTGMFAWDFGLDQVETTLDPGEWTHLFLISDNTHFQFSPAVIEGGNSAAVISVFAPNPTPGVLPLVAMAFMVGSRRRE